MGRKERRGFEQAQKSGEKSLGAAIINQALLDLAGCFVDNGGARSDAKEVLTAQAKAWFSKHNRDFVDICLLADVEPSCVIELALRVEGDPSILAGSIVTRAGFLQRDQPPPRL